VDDPAAPPVVDPVAPPDADPAVPLVAGPVVTPLAVPPPPAPLGPVLKVPAPLDVTSPVRVVGLSDPLSDPQASQALVAQAMPRRSRSRILMLRPLLGRAQSFSGFKRLNVSIARSWTRDGRSGRQNARCDLSNAEAWR
jgi:hypothetical protein